MTPLIVSIAALGFIFLVAFLMRRRKPATVRRDTESLLEVLKREGVKVPPKKNAQGYVAFETASYFIEWDAHPNGLRDMVWIWPRLHDGTKNNDDSLKLVFRNGKSTHGCVHSEALALWVREQIGPMVEGREIRQAQ